MNLKRGGIRSVAVIINSCLPNVANSETYIGLTLFSKFFPKFSTDRSPKHSSQYSLDPPPKLCPKFSSKHSSNRPLYSSTELSSATYFCRRRTPPCRVPGRLQDRRRRLPLSRTASRSPCSPGCTAEQGRI